MVEFEADGALAAAAVMAAADAGVDQVVVCTPDKDLARCVRGDRVVQLDRRTRELRDESAVRQKFGVPPTSIPDWLALVGDSADGYPGLPGWGEKSAATVLARYQRLEHIPKLAAEWDVPVRGALRLATTLTEQWERALLFRELATLRADAPIGADVDALRWRGPRADFAAWSERLGTPTLSRSARSLPLELHVLVRRRPRIVGDEAEPRFRDARTHSLQEGQLPDRKDHGLVVDQLLDAMEERLALLRVELTRLLLEEPVDVGVSPVGVGAARDGERLDPGGRVAEDAAQPVDDVLELLLLIRLDEPRPLERAKPRLDADGLKIVQDRLGVHAGPGIAPEIPGIEALRVPGLREELPGLARIVGVERRPPVEVEAGGDDAPGYLGEPEGHGLVDRLAVHRVVGRETHAPVVPRRARIPLVGEDQPVSGHERSRPQGEPGRAAHRLTELTRDRVGDVHF